MLGFGEKVLVLKHKNWKIEVNEYQLNRSPQNLTLSRSQSDILLTNFYF